MKEKKTLNVQSYTDARIIADLAKYLKTRGINHNGSYSKLLNILIKSAWLHWNAEFFETTEEALEFLANEGFSVAQLSSNRMKQAISKAMAAETFELETEDNSIRAKQLEKLFME